MDGLMLLLAFDRDGEQEAAFAFGFECGRIYAACRSDVDEVVEMVNAENAEMMLRIADATGRPVRSVELGHGWLEVTFGSPT